MATLRANYEADLQALYVKLEERSMTPFGSTLVTCADAIELIHILKAMLRNFDRLVKNE